VAKYDGTGKTGRPKLSQVKAIGAGNRPGANSPSPLVGKGRSAAPAQESRKRYQVSSPSKKVVKFKQAKAKVTKPWDANAKTEDISDADAQSLLSALLELDLAMARFGASIERSSAALGGSLREARTARAILAASNRAAAAEAMTEARVAVA